MIKQLACLPSTDALLHPCEYCEEPIELDEYLYAKEIGANGYYCDNCEWFHYFDASQTRPTYRLYLEEKSETNEILVKQNNVTFKKRLSPLRYPGGKSKLIDFVGEEINPEQLQTVVSPFTGGGSVEWALLESGLTTHLVLNDKDPDVSNFWSTVVHQPKQLIHYIEQYPLSESLYQKAHSYMTTATHNVTDNVEKAFLFLINNRCSFSGIYNAGRMGGKNGSLAKLSQRYNPTTLIRQINTLTKLVDAKHITVEVFNQSYEDIIEDYAWSKHTTLFIDPPYITEQASSIYRHSFNDDHHHALFSQLNNFWHSHPSVDILLFYDNHHRINEFDLPDDSQIIHRKYTIHN